MNKSDMMKILSSSLSAASDVWNKVALQRLPFIGHEMDEMEDGHISLMAFLIGMDSPIKDKMDERGVGVSNVRVHKTGTRENALTPVIEDAIREANSENVSTVYRILRRYARNAIPPFTGDIDGGNLFYEEDNGKIKAIHKESLRSRMKRRHTDKNALVYPRKRGLPM